jgi:type II secretory ATPase GspE/PulE/Tfp pilus assembly ATPase PilB-like protein
MSPLDTFPSGPLLLWGGVWIATAVGWAVACLWVERDAADVFGRTRPWKPLLFGLGVALVAGTCLLGSTAAVLTAVALTLVMAAYVVSRESAVAPADRLIPANTVDVFRERLERLPGVKQALERLRGSAAVRRRSGPSGGIVLLKKDGAVFGGREAADREAAEAVQTARRIIGDGIDVRATDIHVEPRSATECQIRFRIDGIMQTRETLPLAAGRAVISTLKVVGDMDIAERRRPQDGTFAVLAGSRRFDVRVASGPTNFGEKVALRLLDADGGIVRQGLAALGMRESMARTLRDVVQRSHGMLVVAGPTGSGKTTTVYAALAEIDVLTRNVVTIEDPVEYRLDNISQTAVNNAAELTFAKILRSVLRQDPDVILVGEIRDRETAEIAMQAALTGHFVFTTLHANDSATTVTRLLDIGCDATLIQSAVTAVLAQRLVRILCPDCKQPYEPGPDELRRLGIPADKGRTFYKEQGCEKCLGTGYRGRTGVYELMLVESDVRKLLVGRPSLEEIRGAARKGGTRSLWQSALLKVVEGTTSLSEVERVVR